MDKYQEALERAKQGLPIDEVFPELKESEDEKIRKKLVEYISDWKEGQMRWNSDKEFCSRALAYLERQKEQQQVTFYVPEGVDMSSPKAKIAVILGQYKAQTKISDEEYYSMLKYIGGKEQQPAEWSEEDEGMLNCIIATLCEESHGGREANNKMVTWLENRLKSLRPQPRWKPSEEQMKALMWQIKNTSEGSWQRRVSEDLYNDLQKLL